jgi:hypothetical protein
VIDEQMMSSGDTVSLDVKKSNFGYSIVASQQPMPIGELGYLAKYRKLKKGKAAASHVSNLKR